MGITHGETEVEAAYGWLLKTRQCSKEVSVARQRGNEVYLAGNVKSDNRSRLEGNGKASMVFPGVDIAVS